MASGALSLVAAAAPAAGDVIEGSAVLHTGAMQGQPPEGSELTGVVPVAPGREIADAADLVKAVQLAEEQIARADAEQREAELRRAADLATAAAEREDVEMPEELGPGCDVSTSALGAVKSWVRDAAEALACRFGEPTMFGVAGRGGPSDHPDGLALDFMVDRATGDDLAACALGNLEALGVKYVIWRQRINTGDGWEGMEDRGGATANHMDHVHISFERQAGSGAAPAC